MNHTTATPRRGDGIGCECSAHSWSECGCPDADWTPSEVYELRDKLARAVEIAEEFWNNQKQAVTVYHGELADELAALKATLSSPSSL